MHGLQHPKLTASLNNLGAALIETGNYAQAISCLSSAFQHSKTALEIRTGIGQRIGERYHPAACIIDIWMMRDTTTDEKRPQLQYCEFVYTHPMKVPTQATSPSEISVAVAIAFNLAVAHHLASLQGCTGAHSFQGNSKEELLRQALRHYQHAFRLQRTQARTSQSPFFFMACINNIGVVFDNLGEKHQSEECFTHLLSLLMYISSTGSVEPSRFEFFFTNTTSRLTSDVCGFGAAAA